MDFFDDAVNKTKEVFDVVSKKTGEVINVGKIKYEIAALKSKAQKDYETLGKIYYNQLKQSGEVSADVAELFSAIEEKCERIEVLESAIKDLKNCVVCPKCGAEQDKSAIFCNVCGEKIEL